MSNEIAIITPKNLEESERLSVTLAKSMLLPHDLKGKPSDVLAIILTGAELGLAPMQAVRGIQVIKGKPSLSADLMAALCKRRKDVCEYLTPVTLTAEKAVYETKRVGDPKPTTMEFTIQDAQRAGLAGSDTYRKFPQAMLKARCLSAICRAVYPDVCMGLYDPDELAPANIDAPAPAPVEKDVTPAPVIEQPKTKALAEKIHARRMEIIDVPSEPEPKAAVPEDIYGSGKPLMACTDEQLTNQKKMLLSKDWGPKKKKEVQAKLDAILAEEERRQPQLPLGDEPPPNDDEIPFGGAP